MKAALSAQTLGNGAEGVIDAENQLRSSALTKPITIANRAVIEGQGFQIRGVRLPDSARGTIRMQIKLMRD